MPSSRFLLWHAGVEADGAGPKRTYHFIASTADFDSVAVNVHQVHPVTGMGPAGSIWTGLNPLPATVIGVCCSLTQIIATHSPGTLYCGDEATEFQVLRASTE